MEISAQNPAAAQTVNPYDADKVVEKRNAEKNAIRVQDAKADDKIKERKAYSRKMEDKRAQSKLETRSADYKKRSEMKSLEEADSRKKDRQQAAIKKISVYA